MKVRAWLTILLAGCTTGTPLRALDVRPAVPYVPATVTDWPVWSTPDGLVIGGTGARVGLPDTAGLRPGIGIGAILLPSVRVGSLLGFPGTLPWPHPAPLPPSFPVWAHPSDVEAHASDAPTVLVPAPVPLATPQPSSPSVETLARSPATSGPAGPGLQVIGPSAVPVALRWTKMGLTALPPAQYTGWPAQPHAMTPWGPVVTRPTPLPSNLQPVVLGFPTGDGTPVSLATFIPFFRRFPGHADIVLFDFVTRALHRPPATLPLEPDTVGVVQRDGVLLVGRETPTDRLKLADLLSGGFDPLPELRNPSPLLTGNLSWTGEFIAYTVPGPEGRRRVQLFDRRTRTIDRLARLNGEGNNFSPAVDQTARHIVYTTLRDGQTDLAIYDTITGLTDPLPELNTGNDEHTPAVDDAAHWLTFLVGPVERGQVRLFDRRTRRIDTLPELNAVGPIVNVGITGDGLVLYVIARHEGRLRAFLQARPSGFIDPLPEINAPGADVSF